MMNAATIPTDSRLLPSVTIGTFRSRHKGEILLVYLNEGQADATILCFDQLSGKDRHWVRATAQDPLRLLKRTKAARKASRSVA